MSFGGSIRGFMQRLVGGSRSQSRMIVVDRAPPAVRYVNAILAGLAEKPGHVDLRVPLSEIPDYAGPLPPFEQVENRLKVLSGLNPVPFARPTVGRFEHDLRGRVFTVETRFDDRGEASSCRVSVRGPAAKPPS